ncbi:MAG: hydrogenase maturation protease [Candidatus Nezhaarchaeales archaeon]
MVGLKRRVVVVGLGNVLMGDDGVGVRVAEELLRLNLPPSVAVYPVGTPGLALLHLIEGYEKVVLIDAIEMGGEPGTVYRLDFSPSLFNDVGFLSMHDFDAVAALRLAIGAGVPLGEVVIIGIEPKRICFGEALSSEVEASIPKVVGLVLKEVGEGEPHATLP